MKCIRLLDVIVVATLLTFVFHFFWILVPQDIVLTSKELQSQKSRARLLKLLSAQGNFTKLHQVVEQCLVENGDGIKATRLGECNLRLQYPNGTENSWVYRRPESGVQVREAKSLSWDYNLCTLMKFWEKAKTRPTVVTQELFDCYLKEEIPMRILYHFVSREHCKDTEVCFQRVRRFLPKKQPFAPGQAGHCALVGNAASLISNVTFGEEIDAHDTVIRINDARTGDKYLKWTGQKTTFRFVNERVTKSLLPFIRKTPIMNETIVLRRALGGSTLKRLKAGSMGNAIYVSPMTEEGSGLEADHLLGYSSGFLALNFAFSICKSVDIYGFSIDPGPQPSWQRYFSGPKFGHMPLTNRAYFLLLECLQVVRLKSAEHIFNGRKTTLPAAEVIQYLHTVSKAYQEERGVEEDPIKHCHDYTVASSTY
ncbi:unnamed protein product [Calypogeia fissa]